MAEEMGIFEVLYHCRAMRRLKPDPVPEDVLLRLIDAASRAPSGGNMQGARWIVVRDPEQKQRIAALNREAVLAYAGPGGSRAASVSHQDPAKRERQRQAVLWQAEHLAAAPALIFACLEFGDARPDTFAAGAGTGGSVWPGVQNLLLAARALGLGAALTTLVLRDRAAVKAVLTLPETIEPFCMVPVGYPVGQFGPVTRRPVAEVMRWDRWS